MFFMKRISISRDILYEWIKKYNLGLNSYELAKEYGVSQNTVLRRLKEANFTTRKTKAVNSNDLINQIAEVYQKNKEMSLSKLAKRFNLSREGLKYRFDQKQIKIRSSAEMTSKENKKRAKKINLGGKLDHNFAYVLGVLYGDGYVSSQGIHLQCIDKDFAEAFSKAVGNWLCGKCVVRRYFHKKSNTTFFRVDFYSGDLVRWLNKRFGSFYCKEFVIPYSFILKQNKIFVVAFIRGLFDSEAYWGLGFGLINKKALTQIREIIIELGYNPTKIVRGSTAYYFRLNSYLDREKYCNEIGFNIKRKQEKLRHWLSKHTDIHTSRLQNIQKAIQANTKKKQEI